MVSGWAGVFQCGSGGWVAARDGVIYRRSHLLRRVFLDMAKPRVFISSTFFDLKHVRGELEKFIRDMGYDPVLNERGHIPYGSQEALEKYCYAEIENVHIVVAIIGGRFGASARGNKQNSISNIELKTAIEQNKQVYIFIESGVHSEYQTYLKNKGKEGVAYSHVDDGRIYGFIEEMYTLPNNNQITPFDSVYTITAYLKEQWAGLFEVYLEQQERSHVTRAIEKIHETAGTLNRVVELFMKEQKASQENGQVSQEALGAIILQNHPVFSHLKSILGCRYRIFFTSMKEMEAWLQSARSGRAVQADAWDDETVAEYFVNLREKKHILYVALDLFDADGNLRPMLPGDWDNSLVSVSEYDPRPVELDEEIPF